MPLCTIFASILSLSLCCRPLSHCRKPSLAHFSTRAVCLLSFSPFIILSMTTARTSLPSSSFISPFPSFPRTRSFHSLDRERDAVYSFSFVLGSASLSTRHPLPCCFCTCVQSMPLLSKRSFSSLLLLLLNCMCITSQVFWLLHPSSYNLRCMCTRFPRFHRYQPFVHHMSLG